MHFYINKITAAFSFFLIDWLLEVNRSIFATKKNKTEIALSRQSCICIILNLTVFNSCVCCREVEAVRLQQLPTRRHPHPPTTTQKWPNRGQWWVNFGQTIKNGRKNRYTKIFIPLKIKRVVRKNGKFRPFFSRFFKIEPFVDFSPPKKCPANRMSFGGFLSDDNIEQKF